MPRGVKRSEIEIVQAEILLAEKSREKSLQAAAAAKKAITKLHDKIEQQYAREIAKACRASGIPLEEVLGFVKTRQTEIIGVDDTPPPALAKTPKAPAEKKKGKPGPRAKAPRKAAVGRKKAKKSEVPPTKPVEADTAIEAEIKE